MIEAVIFDIDGVLVHPWRFRDALTSRYGITPAMTAPFFKGPFLDCIIGRADVLDTLPPFLETWGWTRSTPDFVREWCEVENAPRQPLLSIVAELRSWQLPCFAASNQERHRARYLAEEMGFARLFDGLFFSCDLGVTKPHRDFYTAIARTLDKPGDSLLFFDDVEEYVEGARAAGWQAEPYSTVERLTADLARYIGRVPAIG